MNADAAAHKEEINKRVKYAAPLQVLDSTRCRRTIWSLLNNWSTHTKRIRGPKPNSLLVEATSTAVHGRTKFNYHRLCRTQFVALGVFFTSG